MWLWRPFLRCYICFQKQWDIRNSLVDAFVTFLQLSYVKFLSVSFDILTPTISWDSRRVRQPPVLYYNGTVNYCSKEHLPYAVLAITVLLVFILLPILLLCVYPCRCFQRLLNRCHFWSQALHMFMDAFQGCFKDGTNGTRDCCYLPAITWLLVLLSTCHWYSLPFLSLTQLFLQYLPLNFCCYHVFILTIKIFLITLKYFYLWVQ